MSSTILNMLVNQLDDQTIKQISNHVGIDEGSAKQAMGTALPALLVALDRNASDPRGAQALTNALRKDHDGSILNNIPAALSNEATLQDGAAILGHILGGKGGKSTNLKAILSDATGLTQKQVEVLLQLAAPLLLGALGKAQHEGNLDSQQVAGVLHTEKEAAQSSLSGLAGLLDLNRSGSVMDELISFGSRLLSGLFGGKR
jgi:hypothetical protein